MIHTVPFIAFLLLSYRPVCQPDYPALPAEEYAIHSVVIDRFVTCGNGLIQRVEACTLFIRPTTDVSCADEYKLIELNQLIQTGNSASFRADTSWQSFIKTLKPDQFKRYTVTNALKKPGKKIYIWTPELNTSYFGKGSNKPGFFGLRNDYKNFAGILSFSKVVYSADGNKAICYFSKISDGEAGAGYFIFLERKSTTWQLIESRMIWIS